MAGQRQGKMWHQSWEAPSAVGEARKQTQKDQATPMDAFHVREVQGPADELVSFLFLEFSCDEVGTVYYPLHWGSGGLLCSGITRHVWPGPRASTTEPQELATTASAGWGCLGPEFQCCGLCGQGLWGRLSLCLGCDTGRSNHIISGGLSIPEIL